MRVGTAIIGLMVAIAAAQPATACSLPIEPFVQDPEKPVEVSPEAWAAHLAIMQANQEQARRVRASWDVFNVQEQLWKDADHVFLARIEAVFPRKLEQRWGGPIDVQDVSLLPVLNLKGDGGRERFTVGFRAWSSCGLVPSWDALGGKPGETFVVYVRGGPPSQETVSDAIAVGNLVESQVRAALGLHQ